MTWLTPLTGLFLALAVIPPLIALYFLKLRRRPLTIGSTMLWRKSVEDLQANAPFQRLRWNLLLLLQLLVLGLLILSVMQPQVVAGQLDGGRTVFLIDTSASMSATDGPDGVTRLEQAKQLARERIEALYGRGLFGGSPGETMIVTFSDRAEIVSRFTDSRQQLIAAIDRIQPTHGESSIQEALKLARAYTTNVVDVMGEARPTGEPAHLELFSDGRIADLEQQVLRGESITFHAVGAEHTDNIAIASMAIERPYERPTAVEVFASLINHGETEVTCDVQISVDGTARGIREARVPGAQVDSTTGVRLPGRNNIVFAPFEEPRGAIIEVANLRSDALMADNVVQLVLQPPKQLRVALVAPKSFVLRSAMAGMPLAALEIISAEEFDALVGDTEVGRVAELDQFDVIVLDNHVPPNLPPGRFLCFGRTPPLEVLNDYGDGETQLVLSVREEHPALRFVNLDNVLMQKFRRIQASPDVEVLVEGSHGPAIVEVTRDATHVLYVTFDVLDSNWPYLRSFMTFIFNAVEYLGHLGEGLAAPGLQPGEAITTRLPVGATNIELTLPDGRIESLEVPDPTQLSWGPTTRSGLHVLRWSEPGKADRQTRAFAVNLLSEQEGDLRVQSTLQIGQNQVEGQLLGDGAYRALWPWAIGLCLALMLLEWWIYNRRTAI